MNAPFVDEGRSMLLALNSSKGGRNDMVHEFLFRATSYVLLACLAVTTVSSRGEDVLSADPAYRQPNQRGEAQEAVSSSDSRQIQRRADLPDQRGKQKQPSAPGQPSVPSVMGRALADPDAVVGRWRWFVDGEEVPELEFEPGGTVKYRVEGSWILQDSRERRYRFSWGNEHLDVMTLSADGMVLRGKNNHGAQIEGRRIEADVAAKADVAVKADVKSNEQAAPTKTYELSGGVRMNDAEIKAHNEHQTRVAAALFILFDPAQAALAEQGQAAVLPMIKFFASGDKAGLRKYTTDLSSHPVLAREVERTLLHSPTRDMIITRDGRAFYLREMWEEATAFDDPLDEKTPPQRQLNQIGDEEKAKERFDVRGIRWLWSVEQVKQAEKIDLDVVDASENVRLLSGDDTIAGRRCKVIFAFFKDELVQIECQFESDDLDTYQFLHQALRSKYGASVGLADKVEAESGVLSTQQKVAVALKGLLTKTQFFVTPRTEVELSESSGRQLQLTYKANFSGGKEKAAKMLTEVSQKAQKVTSDKL